MYCIYALSELCLYFVFVHTFVCGGLCGGVSIDAMWWC